MNSFRVLIIEDSEDDTILMVRHIRRSGLEPEFKRVETAADLENALCGEHWDIILADYSMPSFSGLEALKLVKQGGYDIPFILISGKVGEDTAVEAMKEGAHDYILKDNLTRLVPAIKRELKENAIREEKRRIEIERKLTEKALIESEENFYRLFELSPTGIAIIDKLFRVRLVNPAILKLLELDTREKIIGKRLMDFISAEKCPDIASNLINTVNGNRQPFQDVIPIKNSSGEDLLINFLAGYYLWGGDPAVQIIVCPYRPHPNSR
ncbi:MAG: response regulator [Promethearchaeota archaeon]